MEGVISRHIHCNKPTVTFEEICLAFGLFYSTLYDDVIITMPALCTQYYFKGNLDAAVILIQRAIQIDETVYGTEHPDLALDFDALGELFDMQARVYPVVVEYLIVAYHTHTA